MLSVICDWLYVIFTAGCLGWGFSCMTEKALGYRFRHTDSFLMAGLVIATVYAQIFSLFYKVGLLANLLMIGVSLLILFLTRKNLSCLFSSLPGTDRNKESQNHREEELPVKDSRAGEYISEKSNLPKEKKGNQGKGRITFSGLHGRWRWIAVPILFLLWAYFTSRGYLAYDTDLYHAQSIRWIEEYGVVAGLGNLHERFAYNSSSFCLTALYSMSFLTGHSLHTMSGFFALVLSLTSLDLVQAFRRRRLTWSDWARIGAIYYLTVICDEVNSPASDYPIMCVIFWIIIRFISLLEEKESRIAPYALLCVCGVYALTIKLTAGLILILVIKPAWMLLKERRWKEILLYISLGILTAAPWMIRTVIISGWLLYPFTALDLFQVDWKMDAGCIALDAAQIKTWARGLYDASLVDLPFWEWVPGWFWNELTGIQRLLILGDVLGCIYFVGAFLRALIRRDSASFDRLLVLFTVLCSYLFWQFSAPMVRYGYAYVLLVVTLAAGDMLSSPSMTLVRRVVCLLLLLYGGYKCYRVAEYLLSSQPEAYMVWQIDYGTYEMQAYELDGVTIYVPLYGDRQGYDPFPAAPTLNNIELRGDGLADGFRRVSQ